MGAIRKNPYRTLGLLSNATEKELQKQISTIKRYAEVGKIKSFDFDFPFLGDLCRESCNVQEAASKIEQAKNRVHYALFWFIQINHVDIAAFNHLKENHIEKAQEIWEKLIKDNEVTGNNFSAIVNLSTLKLGLTTLNGSFSPEQFANSIELKRLIINSDFFIQFIKSVAGNNICVDNETVLKEFIDECISLVKPYLDKKNGITTSQLIESFANFPITTKQYLVSKFTERPINNIEAQVEKLKLNRNSHPENCAEYSQALYNSTKADFILLKKVLSSKNVQYQVLVNKVADEILQCSFILFNHFSSKKNSAYDPFEDALSIAKYAKSLTPTGQVKNRVDEALSSLEQMQYREVNQIIDFLNQIIELYAQVEKENSGIHAIMSGRRSVVNEDKIMGIAKPLFELKILEKLAKSGNEVLINDFFNSLNKLINKISYRNSDFFNKKKTAFIAYLPITNSIKFKLEQAKLENEIKKFRKDLSEIKNKKMYANELQSMENEMVKIKAWQMFRSQETRERQITEQQGKIDSLISKGESERKKEISRLEEQIVIKNIELTNLSK